MFFKLNILWQLFLLRWNKMWYSRDVRALQQIHWTKLSKAMKHSPFYRNLALNGEPISRYPLMNKQKFMNNFDEINSKKIKKIDALNIATQAEISRDFSPTINGVTVGLSTGTSGNRGIFLASEKERAMWVACILDRVIGFSFKPRTVAFFLRANSNLYESARSSLLQFNFYDLLNTIEEHVVKLNNQKIDILVGQPSLLLELAQQMEMGTLYIKPTKIISVAEILYPEDASYLSSIFGQTIHQVYQCTEGFLAATCKHGTLHINEDFIHIEKKFIDNKNGAFFPVITDLKRSTQPVVRYELNDILHPGQKCKCNSPFMAIDHIEGRSDDILVFESNNGLIKIFPDYFRRAIVQAHENIRNYLLVQNKIDNLKLFVEGNEELYELAKKSVYQLLSSKGVDNVQIERSIERIHDKGNKLRRIRNDDRKTN